MQSKITNALKQYKYLFAECTEHVTLRKTVHDPFIIKTKDGEVNTSHVRSNFLYQELLKNKNLDP